MNPYIKNEIFEHTHASVFTTEKNTLKMSDEYVHVHRRKSLYCFTISTSSKSFPTKNISSISLSNSMNIEKGLSFFFAFILFGILITIGITTSRTYLIFLADFIVFFIIFLVFFWSVYKNDSLKVDIGLYDDKKECTIVLSSEDAHYLQSILYPEPVTNTDAFESISPSEITPKN